jgi:hypothetical protein
MIELRRREGGSEREGLFLIEMDDNSLRSAGVITRFFAISLVLNFADVGHGSQARTLGARTMSSSLERICAKQTKSAHLGELRETDRERQWK